MTDQPHNIENDSTPLDEAKRIARAAASKTRDGIPEDEREKASLVICQKVLQSRLFEDANALLTYIPFKSEVSTWPLIQRALDLGKAVCAPIAHPESKQMSWHKICGKADLKKGAYGILEPAADTEPISEEESCSDKALILVPGLLFDIQGFRLGYGGGYYDRFLDQAKGTSIGLAFKEQMPKSLKEMGLIEAHDIALDHVVSNEDFVALP